MKTIYLILFPLFALVVSCSGNVANSKSNFGMNGDDNESEWITSHNLEKSLLTFSHEDYKFSADYAKEFMLNTSTAPICTTLLIFPVQVYYHQYLLLSKYMFCSRIPPPVKSLV